MMRFGLPMGEDASLTPYILIGAAALVLIAVILIPLLKKKP